MLMSFAAASSPEWHAYEDALQGNCVKYVASSRKTLAADTRRFGLMVQHHTIAMLMALGLSSIHLTTDLWKSAASHHYMGVMACIPHRATFTAEHVLLSF
ncbi:hypothetical protein KIPB_015992, partial [Kipferlia bialata]|eukprot:g15992.t1